MRSGKKFVRRWDYTQVALAIAGVRQQYESEDAFKSVRSDSLFGEVTKKIGLQILRTIVDFSKHFGRKTLVISRYIETQLHYIYIFLIKI